ncbi:MAG: ImmA/IrrE family metallo-endopeptidase [Chloroflexi bacterium]|nr:ImmA/IrrE family metallo-endopeptidase [Chloroflexota bacterium]
MPSRDLKAFLRHAEDHAAELRRRAGVGQEEPLDPRRLAPELKLKLASLGEIKGLSAEDRALLSGVGPEVWSGAGIPLPNGYTLVILHPDQTPGRAIATIMEEVCHAYYGHAPSQLITLPGGIVKREYNADSEAEAYWTGAAALLPAKVVARAVWRGTAGDLSTRYGVSRELVEFRIKTLMLWREYRREGAA